MSGSRTIITATGTGTGGGGGAGSGDMVAANNLSELPSKPTARSNLGLGTAAVKAVPASGDASTTQVVQGDDTRLSNARTPTAHASTHAPAGTDPVTGLTAASFVAGSVDGVAGVASLRTLGTGVQQAAAGNDTRLSDPRTPVDGSVTAVKLATGAVTSTSILDGTILDVDINTSAGIAASKVSGTALTAANNLSDVGVVGTARTNLGLGTASVKDVAASGDASSTQVVQGSDSRLASSVANVAQFGAATGNTGAANLMAFQAACDYAIANNQKVYIPGGTWNVNSGLLLGQRIKVEGAGRGRTIINVQSTGTFVASNSAGTRLFDWAWSDMTITTTTAAVGFDMDSVSTAHMRNLVVSGFSSIGISIHSATSGGAVYNRFFDVTVQSVPTGVKIAADGSNASVFIGCRANTCSVRGFDIQGTNDTSIVSTQIEQCGVGVFLDGTVSGANAFNRMTNVRFENNTTGIVINSANVSDTILSGIWIDGSTTTPITDNGLRTRQMDVITGTKTNVSLTSGVGFVSGASVTLGTTSSALAATAAAPLYLRGSVADGATAVGNWVGNGTTLANAGAAIAGFCADTAITHATPRAYVMAADGSYKFATGPTIGAGTGSPEGVRTAPVGSVWLRSDGGANTSHYVKESGAGNTGWVGGSASSSGLTDSGVKTGAYTAAANQIVPVDTTSGAVTITLPTAPADRTMVAVKHITQGGTNAVSVTCAGADVFNKAGGGTTLTLSLLNQGMLLSYSVTPAVWYVVADDFSLAQLDARYPLRANNLSDLGSTTTARSNLGLGTASVKDVPVSGDASSTQVVYGTDSRLTNTRTPSVHASTHAPAGSDPVTGLTSASFLAASVDGVAGTASLRTLGTGAQQAAAGNDTRITGIQASFDARTWLADDHGIPGDNSTDVTTALDTLITSVNAAGGGTIQFQDGKTYLYGRSPALGGSAASIVMKSNVTLMGNATLKVRNGICTDVTASYFPIYCNNISNFKIRDLTFVGNSANNTTALVADMITMSGCENGQILNVTINDCIDSGVMYSDNTNCLLDGIRLNGAKDLGLYLNDTSNGTIATENTVTNCHITGAPNGGIALKRGAQKFIVANNTIYDCGNGITMEQGAAAFFGHDSIIANNRIRHIGYRGTTEFYGIDLRGCDYVQCVNNRIEDVVNHAIVLSAARYCTVVGNVVNHTTGTLADGIRVQDYPTLITTYGTTSCVISNNVVTDVTGDGLNFIASAAGTKNQHLTVSNNQFLACAHDGVESNANLDSAVIVGNIFQGTTTDCSFNASVTNVNFLGNRRLNNTGAAPSQSMTQSGEDFRSGGGLVLGTSTSKVLAASTIPLYLGGQVANNSSAVGNWLGNATTLATAGGRIAGFTTDTPQTHANPKSYIDINGYYEFAAGGNKVMSGTGSPETVVTAPVGSQWLRSDGGPGASLYVKESGAGNTGWVGYQAGLADAGVKTGAYTALANQIVPVDTTSGAITITLPTAPADHAVVAVKHITQGGSNVVTVACGGADVFNKAGGGTTLTLPMPGQGTLLTYSATLAVWYVVADDFPLSQLDLRYPLRSNNLSDLASTTTARTNLGLGTAAVKDVPASGDASSTQVVYGTDTRLGDLRTPIDGSVTAAKLGTGAVTSTAILDGTIVDADINAAAGIAATKVAGTALTAGNNLSDVGTVATARTNLGLGTAATKDVPASGDASAAQAVYGTDSRLTNARTPSAHASTHAPAGSDPITGYSTVDRQVFTASGTWTMPTNAKIVHIGMVGGGGGGGAGALSAAGAARGGGAGGGGGGLAVRTFAASDLTSPITVTVGAGGAGATGQVTSTTAGAAGTAGASSLFGAFLVARPGSGGGGGGLAAVSTGGAGGSATSTGGAGGAGSATGAAGLSPALSGGGAGGGGAGGGLTTGNAESVGGAGGVPAVATTAAGTAGAVTGGAGGTGGSFTTNMAAGGSGGGGGGSSAAGTGGAGGLGGSYGSGGGGGGAAVNGQVSGAGAAGAAGIIVVITECFA